MIITRYGKIIRMLLLRRNNTPFSFYGYRVRLRFIDFKRCALQTFSARVRFSTIAPVKPWLRSESKSRCSGLVGLSPGRVYTSYYTCRESVTENLNGGRVFGEYLLIAETIESTTRLRTSSCRVDICTYSTRGLRDVVTHVAYEFNT